MIFANDVLVTIDNISKQIGDKTIISESTFGIHQYDKIGLIGVNGSGKTTLLTMIAGLTDPSGGTITFRNNTKLGYLPQNPIVNPELTVFQHVLPDHPDHIEEDYKYKSILTQLGLTEFDKKFIYLSGGQKRKADIARVLVSEPDLYILDEPTNHLDLDTIEWLQDYLLSIKKTIIFVTHDRYFLDSVCNKILEIENNNLFVYSGNYSTFVKGKMQREIDIERKDTRRKAQLKKELEWLNRGAQARTSKPKHHVEKVKELLSKSYLISNAELNISFQTDRLGKTILELHKIAKSYNGNELFRDVEHNFQPRERIGVIGDNGCGKTTLLRIITGDEDPDIGNIKAGVNTHFAYYRQDEDSFDPKLSVYDYIAQYAEVIRTKDGTKFTATEMLKRFLFDGKMQQMKLESLSGGERKRLYLLKSLMFGANFIIMDEPTNDLDIRTLEILEDYLDAFDGCLLIVSHDRFFLDRTVDYLFIFENGIMRKFAGNYSDYLLVKRFEKAEIEDLQNKLIVQRPKRAKKGLNYNEQQELKRLEAEISYMEGRMAELDAKITEEARTLSHEDFSRISHEIQELTDKLENILDRWAELDDIQNGIISPE
ncbi:MAG: hypothetical protein CVU48_03930 [Candidatus Cloacimonetes bacterium HGW-Cloacimonetes-1]|jgi:ATP-binding cassette subfamily F protein uup|nr:MAG: hypothetical protein CVU48_03930 [Candidatus Cloacimonetes bacterium HGW-Cloacimonetes-1]